MILAGDFNARQGDAVFRLFKPYLHDAFVKGRCGWGNTMPNEWPMLRIDQVWLSHELRAERVFTVQTVHSDHRMVVADVSLGGEFVSVPPMWRESPRRLARRDPHGLPF